MIDRTTGKRIILVEHIVQSIFDILTTPVGSRVMRRDYGSLLPRLVDKPANDEHIMQMMVATIIAIQTWETRINTSYVNITPIDTSGRLDIEIEGMIKQTNEAFILQSQLFGNPDAMNTVITGGGNNGITL